MAKQWNQKLRSNLWWNQTANLLPHSVSSKNLPSMIQFQGPSTQCCWTLKFSKSRDKHKLFHYFPLIRKELRGGGRGSLDSVRNV